MERERMDGDKRLKGIVVTKEKWWQRKEKSAENSHKSSTSEAIRHRPVEHIPSPIRSQFYSNT